MRKEDTEFKTIFFIWGYHLYVTIPIRSKSSFMFRVIECGKDCREIEIYLKNYLMFNKKIKPHKFKVRNDHKVHLTKIKISNIIDWRITIKRKSLVYMNKWKIKYFRINKLYNKI